MQQLGVWRAGEKTLRERKASSDRDMVEAARAHEAAVAALHRHFEAEAGAMYKRVRSAKQRQAIVAREAETLRSRRAKLVYELRTLEDRCAEKLAETQQECARVAARLQEEEEKVAQLEATGRRRAPRAAAVADEHMMPDRLHELHEQRQLLRASVRAGREYSAWMEAQLAACAAEERGAHGLAPPAPQRGERGQARRSPRASSSTPIPAAKPPPAQAQAHAQAHAQVQAGTRAQSGFEVAAAAEMAGADGRLREMAGAALDGRTPRGSGPSPVISQSSQGEAQAQGGAHAHAEGVGTGQHAAARTSRKKAPALPDLLGGSGGPAASNARFAAFGAEPEELKSVTRVMSSNIVQVRGRGRVRVWARVRGRGRGRGRGRVRVKSVTRVMSSNIVQVRGRGRVRVWARVKSVPRVMSSNILQVVKP